MKIRFRNAMTVNGRCDVTVTDDRIESVIGQGTKPDADASLDGSVREDAAADRVIDCTHRMLLPGFYNTHCHAAMTIFRGYGEGMPLDRWLNERIFPAEARLRAQDVYVGSLWGIAEMLRGGVVSFTDMYMHCDETARAAIESGIRVNLSNGLVAFDPTEDPTKNHDYLDAKRLFETYHGAANGRVRVDMSIHAEYTSHERIVREMAAYAAEIGANMHLHLSETKAEHEACIARHGMTPTAYFDACGVFDSPTTAAHCVWVDEQDAEILARRGVTVSHNPSSNLKLGSGILPLRMLREAGVRIALGTDGAASNNTLDVMKEMYLASILHKGVSGMPEAFPAEEFLSMATVCGASAQGRDDCGVLAPGKKADLILLDLDALNMYPIYDPTDALVYAASSHDVKMTMVDGRILYENGEYTTIDIEKLRHDMRDSCERYI